MRILALVFATLLIADRAAVADAQTATPKPPQPAPAPSPPAWLGIFLGDAPDGGVQLVEVAPGGPAQKAGLRPGDVVIRLNGREVVDRDSLRGRLVDLRAGDRITVEILRDGRSETHAVEASARAGPAWGSLVLPDPGSLMAPPAPNPLGARLAAIPPELRVRYGAPADAGALVVQVEATAPAGEDAVRVGDVVVRVDGRAVRDPDSLTVVTQVKTVEVVRNGKARVLRVHEGEAQRREIERAIEELRGKIAELERRLASLKESD